MEFSDDSQTLEIITNTKGSSLLGIRVYDDEATLELAQVANGYKVSFNKDKKDVFKIVYTSTQNTNSTVKETSSKIDLEVYSDDTLVKISLDMNVKDDVNPSIEKKNTKNSVSASNISAEDQQKILENIYNFGNLGLLIQSSLGGVMTPSIPDSYNTGTNSYNVVTPSTGTNGL